MLDKIVPCGLIFVLCSLSVAGEVGSLAARQAEFAARPLPAELLPVPRISCPLYVMEYHVWHRAPFGEHGQPGYVHWGPAEDADSETLGPDWMRNTRPVGYPLPGPYDSEDPEIIRWQIRCAKAAGIDGMFVQLFPDRITGTEWGGSHIFAVILDIAAQEGMKVACHDEVQFRQGWAAQKPDVMAERAGTFIKNFGRHPAYLRIKGRPAYQFAFYSPFMSDDDLAKMMQNANTIAGEPIGWVPNMDPGAFYGRPEALGFVATANSNFVRGVSGYTDAPLDWPGLETRLQNVRQARQQYPGKLIGLQGYGGFDNSPYHEDNLTSWSSRRGGRTLVELLRRYVRETPDYILLSSWNDWVENTALEPGLNFEGYAGDPYLYCRILAATKGKKFTPPPLPPKESVDPLMWQPLYGMDRVPPRVLDYRYIPMDPALVVTVADSAGAVRWSSLALHGNAFLAREKGRVVSQGLTSTCGLPSSPDNGSFLLEPDQTFTINLDPKALAGSQPEVYLGLEFADEAAGYLQIQYSADPPVIDYWNQDRQRFPLEARISLGNDGRVKAKVRLLRAFNVSADHPVVNLTLRSKEGKIRVFRVDVFRDAPPAVAGTEMSGAAQGSPVKVYRFKTPVLAGNPPGVVYVLTEDAQKNRSAPFPICGDGFHPTGIRPEEWRNP